MSGYCKCGVYHEEDDDRLCSKCAAKERQVDTELPVRMVRIEYELPPTRVIGSEWYEEDDNATDDEFRAAFESQHPRRVFRKIHRGIHANHDTKEDGK